MRFLPFFAPSRARLSATASLRAPANRRRRAAYAARARLLMEALEERRVPTVFVVNSLLDGAPVADGQLTLREAITAAVTNGPSGDAPAGSATLDTITFASNLAFGTIKLQAAQGELLLNGGGDVRIAGPVASNSAGIVLSGQNATRVFDVENSATAVSIESTTVTQGSGDHGSGISNSGPLTTLTAVAVTQCRASVSSAIDNFATLTVSHCTITRNAVQNGAIGNAAGAALTLSFSRIVGNNSASGAGGIEDEGGTVSIRGSTIAGNRSGSSGLGGGVSSFGVLTIARSTISENSAGTGGGISWDGRSTGGTLTVLSSTIADNTGSVGGGLHLNGGTAAIVNCTIVRNTDTSNVMGASVGGIFKGSGTLVLSNSIVSLNNAGSTAADSNVVVASIDSNNFNFLGGDPGLGPLQDNGGPTQTIAPYADSPVIDNGTNFVATTTGLDGGVPLLHDQRGGHRVIDGNQNGAETVDQGAVEFSPGPIHPIVTGADAGGAPEVKVYDGFTGALAYDFLAYPAGFTGGVRVAAGDVDGDGVDDYVTAAGPGGGPQVNVYSGSTGTLIFAFFAFNPAFTGGVFVAVGDVTQDGFADVIVGQDAGGVPRVKVFDGLQLARGTVTLVAGFLAYDGSFTGGVRVAAGDVNGDGFADVITAKGPGAAPRVRVFSGNGLSSASQALLFDFMAYATTFTGGVYVASGDTNGDGKADIITGAGPGGGPAVNVFSGRDGSVLASFFAYGVNFGGGVRVGAADLNGDGIADIITGRGPGGEPTVKVFDGPTQQALDRFDAYDLTFAGGVFVGGA